MTAGVKDRLSICEHRDGAVVYVRNLKAFTRDVGLGYGVMLDIRAGRGDQNTHKGWVIRWFDGSLPMNGVLWDDLGDAERLSWLGSFEGGDFSGAVSFSSVFAGSEGDAADFLAGLDTSDSPFETVRQISSAIGQQMKRKIAGDSSVKMSELTDLTQALERFARVTGVDMNEATESKPIVEQVREGLLKILMTPHAVYEQFDQVNDGILSMMTSVVDQGMDYFDGIDAGRLKAGELLPPGELAEIDPEQDEDGPPGPKVVAELARRWVNRLRKVRRAAKWAREKNPNGLTGKRDRFAWEATHLLRFMLYVSRPDITNMEGVSHYIFRDFHVETSVKLWIAKNRCRLDPRKGLVEVGDKLNGVPFKGESYYGVAILLPPRHGKTDITIHDAALDLVYDPRDQQAMIHAIQDEASNKMLKPVRSLFENGSERGRRMRKLFPDMRLSRSDNTAHRMRLKCDNPPTNPNLITGSPFTSALGNNLNVIRADDVVPATDRQEASTRRNRIEVFKSTWMTRFQGKNGLLILTGYPHHPEDLVWETVTRARMYKHGTRDEGKEGNNMLLVYHPVGGPNSSPPFKPIFPELYDSRELKKRYNSINNPSIWASNYELTPTPDDQQIVRKVRLYDPMDPAYQRALENAVFHISVDPAAKGVEGSDKAGLIVVAVADVEHEREYGRGMFETYSERMALVVHEDEFYANQHELTAHIVAMASRYEIDTCHIEQVGALGMEVRSAIEDHYGIRTVRIHTTGNKNKASRLRSVAMALEASNTEVNPPVAFPGARTVDEHGQIIPGLIPAQECARIVRYIEQFFSESGYHSLDAFTQVVQYLISSGDIKGGGGRMSNELREGTMTPEQRRRMQMFQQGVENVMERKRNGQFGLLNEINYNVV